MVTVLYFFLPPLPFLAQAALLLVVGWAGTIASTVTERELGLDAGPIVIDEVAGMVVTYLLLPLPEAAWPRIVVLGAGFVFFRFFDILKPWPADRLQHLPGGYGIMADDVMAGIYSNLAVRVLLALGLFRFVPGFAP